MLKINKLASTPTLDFAAEELKKYMRMMIPACDARTYLALEDTDGFRLGLMSDFGLDTSDATDLVLDDIVYIDTTATGGIIAGSNERSVLLAVYEYLRRQGCRWLFPGKDGELIPERKALDAINYRHMATCRYRGPCIEGAESREMILNTLDFLPKIGMNVFMMQFFVPHAFYSRYYNHDLNSAAQPEPVTPDEVMQWKAEAELEMAKRGIQFHDVGHGFTAEPFGINTIEAWADPSKPLNTLPEESKQYMAMLGGERKLYKNSGLCTNFCMSNREARKKVVDYITDYSKEHRNVDYLHVWLADFSNNHCECEQCQKKTSSDWYMILMNELDESLEAAELDTRIVFIVYVDTFWPPVTEKINNPERFTLMMAPISRTYDRSPDPNVKVTLAPYERNKLKLPRDIDSYVAYLAEWCKVWPGSNFSFEYYCWTDFISDPSGLQLATRIFEDIEAYVPRNITGIIGCGTQRCYFPNGYVFYTLARKLFDNSLTKDEILEDYFGAAYGEQWRRVYNYFEKMSACFPFLYILRGANETDKTRSMFYCPEYEEGFKQVYGILEEGRALIKELYNSPLRVRTKLMRVLEFHANYVEHLVGLLIPKCLGDDDEAAEQYEYFSEYLDLAESDFEEFFDLWMFKRMLERFALDTPDHLAVD